LVSARKTLDRVSSAEYIPALQGTLGAEPIEAYLDAATT
jgi:hypothetical protein